MGNNDSNKENEDINISTEPFEDAVIENAEKEEFVKKSRVTEKATKKKGIILALILGLILIGGGIFGYWQYNRQQAKEYKQDVEKVLAIVIVSGSQAESMINEYIQVWNNAIESRYGYELHGEYVFDFNEALQVQKGYFKVNGDIKKLEDDKNTLESLVKQLNNPSENYEDIYDLVIDLHNKYRTYVDYAIDPSGSLLSYGNETAEKSREISEIYQEISMRLGD